MSKVRASHHRNEKRETGVGKPVVAKALFFFGAAAFGSILQRAAPFEARTTWNLHCTRRDAVGGKADTVSIRYKTDGTFTPPTGKFRAPASLAPLMRALSTCSPTIYMYSCSLLVLHCRVGGRGKSQAKTSWAKNQAKSQAVPG